MPMRDISPRDPATRLFCWMLAVCVAASAGASGQTVRPVISELGNPGKGRVEYLNDSDTPLNVVLSVQSFTVDEEGGLAYRALDPNIRVKLSSTSFRIQPHDSFFVFYEAQADSPPAWFVIYADFSGFAFRTQQGMNVRLQLPHTVYLLPKQSLEKSDVHLTRAWFEPQSRTVVLEVDNSGDYFGRAIQTVILSSKKKEEGPGFPIFPRSKRRIEVPLQGMGTPDTVMVEFEHFKLEEKLAVSSP